MKKFLFVLFLLIALAGTGFYFGWAKAQVPPGSYGVLRSKTHGTDPEAIQDGQFRWIWYKLIPGNARVLVLSPRLIKRTLNSSGILPSGAQYAALAGMDADFSWELSGEFSFSIKPEALPSLVENQNLADENAFRDLEESRADNIEAFIRRYLGGLGEGTELETLELSLSLPGLDAEVARAFPEIEKFNCLIRLARFPDFDFYRSVKGLYDDYMGRMHLALREDVVREAETRMQERLRMDTLTQYGELLTKYPILLQYLALEKGLAPAAETLPEIVD